ncbi:uncharacterized protein LOC132267007 isoform X1 [Cornus florida]|uniref:uncharacterized protein LOC132267007 isoform X1 n=1 Tax=Cornus florida TaxID=4283 RepID=UPI0028A0D8D1|nr:uncharacterized protein LOC132267007 isoform X1 [Cornus florida]
MQREERRRKFHESLINMLHPPPPSPPSQQEDEEEALNKLRESLNADHLSDDELEETSSSSPSSDEDESDAQKLTRAQRKRLRRKKLKRAASRRQEIIGPLLPTASDYINCGGENNHVKNEPPDVRRNAAEESETVSDNGGKTTACTNQNKLKQRRMAKRLARERSKKSSNTKNYDQDHQPSSGNEDSIRNSECVDPK